MPPMKVYASFDHYQKDQTPRNRATIKALREFVKRIVPALNETVKWGNGCWVGEHGPVAYVHAMSGYVQFGFFYGSSLNDPKELLEGSGKYVRHIKVRDAAAIQDRSFAALLRQAAKEK
jgi:hypothetical protein